MVNVEGYEGHFADLDGYTVGFETYTADADLADSPPSSSTGVIAGPHDHTYRSTS